MVGDRMDTDVVAGIEAGLETILVLTGSTKRRRHREVPVPAQPRARLDRRRHRTRLSQGRAHHRTGGQYRDRVTTTERPDATRPLAGVRIIEISSFVAVPLAGMTLAQLGAEVIRVDPVGGAADYHRWPVTDDRGQHLLGGAEQGQAVRGGRRALRRGPGADPTAHRRQRRADHECGWTPMAFVRDAGRHAARPHPRGGVRTSRRRHRRRLHGQRGPRLSARHRACRTRRARQPRTACLGRDVRYLRRRSPSRRRCGTATPPGRGSGSAFRWRTWRWRRRAI